jgi:hypothetical protein
MHYQLGPSAHAAPYLSLRMALQLPFVLEIFVLAVPASEAGNVVRKVLVSNSAGNNYIMHTNRKSGTRSKYELPRKGIVRRHFWEPARSGNAGFTVSTNGETRSDLAAVTRLEFALQHVDSNRMNISQTHALVDVISSSIATQVGVHKEDVRVLLSIARAEDNISQIGVSKSGAADRSCATSVQATILPASEPALAEDATVPLDAKHFQSEMSALHANMAALHEMVALESKMEALQAKILSNVHGMPDLPVTGEITIGSVKHHQEVLSRGEQVRSSKGGLAQQEGSRVLSKDGTQHQEQVHHVETDVCPDRVRLSGLPPDLSDYEGSYVRISVNGPPEHGILPVYENALTSTRYLYPWQAAGTSRWLLGPNWKQTVSVANGTHGGCPTIATWQINSTVMNSITVVKDTPWPTHVPTSEPTTLSPTDAPTPAPTPAPTEVCANSLTVHGLPQNMSQYEGLFCKVSEDEGGLPTYASQTATGVYLFPSTIPGTTHTFWMIGNSWSHMETSIAYQHPAQHCPHTSMWNFPSSIHVAAGGPGCAS